jgi:hypothetical protein
LEFGIGSSAASRAGVFLNLEPLTGAVLGVVVFDERLGITAILAERGAGSEDHWFRGLVELAHQGGVIA